MLFRNLASMDVEESIRGNPIDGVVLLCGCDKTTPSLMMGAPAAIYQPGRFWRPDAEGCFKGQRIGSGTGVWQMSEAVRAGKMDMADFLEAESCMNRSRGHCMTMGTASTMASMVESLGMGLPHNAAIPAVDRPPGTGAYGRRRIVEMVFEDLTMDKILTREAFENAIRANAAIGGSTNAVIHLIALAGRVGVNLKLDDIELGVNLPCLLNLQPSGEFLMEDFYYAGGLPVILRELGEAGALHKDALTVNGKSIWENVKCGVLQPAGDLFVFQAVQAVVWNRCFARKPCAAGRCDQASAATPELLTHRGRAVVFENIEQLHETIDDENLDIDETSVMVLKAPGRKDTRDLPRSAICHCRPNCCARESPIWSGSRTVG